MGKPYSEDLRVRVVRAGQHGGTIPEIAEQFGVSISSVVRFRRLHRETGSVSPAKIGGYKGYALAAHEDLIRQLLAEQPDIALAEIKAILATENVMVGQSSISRFLHHLNLRFKKSLRAAEQDRPDVAAARKALQERQPRLDPKRLVFIDETSVATTIARLYGWAPQGERLVQKLPHGNWKTITFIAALRHDRVTAPFVLEGPMTGEMFKAYTEQFLAPTLKRGDIVFMDNVSVHKVDGIEDAIEARGAIPFYLPAYSPDLNPIEQLFAKLKALLRAGHCPPQRYLPPELFTTVGCGDGWAAGLVLLLTGTKPMSPRTVGMATREVRWTAAVKSWWPMMIAVSQHSGLGKRGSL